MSTGPPGPDAPAGPPDGTGGRRPRLRPERRRRGDLVAIALIAVAAVVGTLLVLASGDAGRTVDSTASPPLATTPTGPVPTALAEAWRAESPATPAPLAVGAAVVTAGPDGVAGRDPLTGREAWRYDRPEPPCTVGAGFGDVLAVFRTQGALGTWCSDVAALEPDTGARGPARNADLREGTRLLADRDHVTGTGADHVETWRSDLVLTTEVGRLPTPVQPPDAQPRAGCTNGSVAVGGGTVGMVQRCPGEDSDRLTVVDADPQSSEKPEERASTLLGVRGARLVALTDQRAAWAAPDGTLHVVGTSPDSASLSESVFPLGTAAGPTTDPPGLAAAVRPVGSVLLWWTGTATVALDAGDLSPRWSLPGTLGAGAAWPGSAPAAVAVVPVPDGLAVLDAATGAPRGPTIPVARGLPAGTPVAVAATGTTVVELRGSTVVALRPAG
ncbi:Rv3212 family protein [Actinomycetospora chlora]|uniref:Rv3212 family protein n=1 Tax=Actinomycetospora chlora TaxID=663608 RepID=UPI0031E59EE4